MYNWLRPNGFRLLVKELPSVSFTCQVCNFPTVTAGNATQPTPFLDLPRIGDKLYTDDLRVTFILDEDLENYLEIFNWMKGIGFPDDYQQYAKALADRDRMVLSPDSYTNPYSDMTVSILDSNNNPKINIMFKDAFPVFLSPVSFNIKDDSVEYMLCDASFKFSMFNIERV